MALARTEVNGRLVEDYDYLFKFQVIGDADVGKSSLILRLSDNFFFEDKAPSLGVDFKIKTFDISGKVVKTQVWDSQAKHTPSKGVHAIILAFDLTNRKSFENLKKRIEDIDKFANSNAVVILAGTKCDDIKNRKISREEINHFLQTINGRSITYAETSAKTGEHVEDIFVTASKQLIQKIHEKTVDKNKLPQHGQQMLSAESLRGKLISDLQKYITRVESYKNFTDGFWFFRSSRAINREANYRLAKSLLQDCQDPHKNISSIFHNVDNKRFDIIQQHGLFKRTDYANRGINSTDLNKIITAARAGLK